MYKQKYEQILEPTFLNNGVKQHFSHLVIFYSIVWGFLSCTQLYHQNNQILLTFSLVITFATSTLLIFWDQGNKTISRIVVGFGFPILLFIILHFLNLSSSVFQPLQNILLLIFIPLFFITPYLIYEKRNTLYWLNNAFVFYIFLLIDPSDGLLYESLQINPQFINSENALFKLVQLVFALAIIAIMDKKMSTTAILNDKIQHFNNHLKEEIIHQKSNIENNYAQKTVLLEKIANESSFVNQIFTAIPDLVWVKDLDGAYMKCNKKFEDFFGLKEIDIIGKTDFDLVDIETAEKFRLNDLKILNTQKQSIVEETVIHSGSNQKITFESIKTPTYDTSGNLIGVMGIARDITVRTKIKNALKISKERYKTLIETASDGIYLISWEGIILDINEFATHMIGYTRQEIVNKSLQVICPNWDINKLHETLSKTNSNHLLFESTSLTKSGNCIPVEISLRAVSWNNEKYLFAIARNISERLEREKQIKIKNNELQEAQNIGNMGSWRLDLSTYLVSFSQQVKKILAISADKNNITFNNIGKYIHPSDQFRINKLFKECLLNSKECISTCKIIDEKQQIKHVELRSKFEYNQANKAIAIRGTIQDITKEVDYKNDLETSIQKMNLALSNGGLLAWEYCVSTKKMSLFPNKTPRELDIHKEINSINDFYAQIDQTQIPYFKGKIKQLINNKIKNFTHEIRMINHEGNYKWRHINISTFEDNKSSKLFGTLYNIENKKSLEKVEIEVQEQERVRVSRDIHDSIGQMLVGIRMMVNRSINTKMTLDQQIQLNTEVDELLNYTIKETRLIINNLGISTIRNNSLKETFEDLIRNIEKISKSKIELDWNGYKKVNNSKNAINILRVAQEALTNSIKYSHAELITIRVINTGKFRMWIADNGIGFKMKNESMGFGIKNMTERAHQINASLSIKSDENKGTVIFLQTN